VQNDCTELKNQNQYECREVKCDPVRGGCYVNYKDKYCQDKYGDMCVQYSCARTDSEVTMGSSGCRIYENKTAIRQSELVAAKKDACFEATCNPGTGDVSDKDLCPSRLSNKNCYSSVCTKVNNAYQCKQSDKNRPPETVCTEYKCAASGWVAHAKKDRTSCTNYFLNDKGMTEKDLLCKNVFCSDSVSGGCTFDDIPGCSTNCSNEMNILCVEEYYNKSSLEECYLGSCDLFQDESSEWNEACVPNVEPVNCLNNQELLVLANNSNSVNKCCSVACLKTGGCGVVCVDRPFNDNVCMEYVCTYVPKGENKGIWEWQYVPSDENKTCSDTPCYTRACDAEKGCQRVQDICSPQSTDCDEYSCDDSSGTDECVSKSLLIVTKCAREVCKNNTKVLEIDLDQCEEAVTDKCLVAECIYSEENQSSWCNYTPRPEPSNDPCVIYTCNPENGTFSTTPKCTDGLYCTEDICTVFGECKYKQVACEDELNMEGYPCFEARCREVTANATYKCVRKLIRNAYIDVCGNCIIEQIDSDEETNESSSGQEPDLLECTNAPPRPLLTQGLAAASIALIIIFAVVIGAGIAASGVMGTKTLISRARAADNQSAHSNPLFEGNETEMSNPAFIGKD